MFLSLLSKKGFTIIEVLAALFIIVTGVLGTFVLVYQSISFITVSASRLEASYLAQEGIELVRNMRDGNWLEARIVDVAWDDGLSVLPVGEYYNADYRTQSLPDANCPLPYLGFDGNFYICSSDPDAKFERRIRIFNKQNLDGDGENIPDVMSVLVEISWEERGREHKVTAQENLYRWHEVR